MDDDAESGRRVELDALTRAADRLDHLAEMSELMGDADGAARLRSAASTARLRAMSLLDD